MRIKLILTVSLAAVAAMAVGASAAQAANSGVCQFDGVAGLADPGIKSAQNDLTDGGSPIDTEDGTYQFGVEPGSGDEATCVKVDTDTNEAGNTGQYTVDIDSAGHYTNTLCGTGTAADDGTQPGDATTLSSSAAGFEGPISPRYSITFEAGQGQLSILSGSWDGQPLVAGPGGHVTIIPDDNDGNDATVPCGTQNVTSFTVSGVFTATTL